MSLKFQNRSSSFDQKGFTLLEVLIAMAVLVFISFSIYQATIETYKLRDILTTEGDFYNGIRLATSIMQRDIALLYSPIVTQKEKPKSPGDDNSYVDKPQMQIITTDNLGQSSTFWSAAIDPNGLRPSRFIGSENKISFVSLSHLRIYRDSPETEFAKITYEIKRDEKNTDNPGTYVLVKTESPNAFAMDDTRDTFVRSYEILHGIKKMSYSYLQRDGNTWKSSRTWDSDKEENKNQYPQVIEMKIEVVGPKKQFFEGNFKFRPEIPLDGINPST